MGTRNLTAVKSGGNYVLAQYGQWDGYPSGQGVTALAFCREYLTTTEGREDFKQRLGRVRFPADGEVDGLYTALGIKSDEHGFITSQQAAQFNEAHPYFSRDHGAKILGHVWNAWHAGKEVLTNNSIDFAGDSLFCEWAYVIDLDAGTFEAFEGFNKSPLNPDERFAKSPTDERGNGYYPVRLRAKWPLDALPSEADFLAMLKDEDETDEAAE